MSTMSTCSSDLFRRVEGTVEVALETLLPDEEECDIKPGISSSIMVMSADGQAERLR